MAASDWPELQADVGKAQHASAMELRERLLSERPRSSAALSEALGTVEGTVEAIARDLGQLRETIRGVRATATAKADRHDLDQIVEQLQKTQQTAASQLQQLGVQVVALTRWAAAHDQIGRSTRSDVDQLQAEVTSAQATVRATADDLVTRVEGEASARRAAIAQMSELLGQIHTAVESHRAEVGASVIDLRATNVAAASQVERVREELTGLATRLDEEVARIDDSVDSARVLAEKADLRALAADDSTASINLGLEHDRRRRAQLQRERERIDGQFINRTHRALQAMQSSLDAAHERLRQLEVDAHAVPEDMPRHEAPQEWQFERRSQPRDLPHRAGSIPDSLLG